MDRYRPVPKAAPVSASLLPVLVEAKELSLSLEAAVTEKLRRAGEFCTGEGCVCESKAFEEDDWSLTTIGEDLGLVSSVQLPAAMLGPPLPLGPLLLER